MRKVIAVRSSPDWVELSMKLKQKGYLDPADYMPDPVPPGFPENIGATLELWNKTLSRDFFSVRADVAAIARETWQSSQPDAIVPIKEFRAWAATQKDQPVCIFPTDDDDFYAPHLFEGIQPSVRKTIVRFPSPLYAAELFHRPVDIHFPRLTLVLRRLHGLYPSKLAFLKPFAMSETESFGLKTIYCDFLCQTNNYALLGNLHDWHENMAEVGEHILASRALGRFKYKRNDVPDRIVCLTNKHPCSISRLSVILKDGFNGDMLRRGVEEFVRSFDAFAPPENMEWTRPHLLKFRDLFAAL